MTALLILSGLLLVVSGVVKLHAAQRTKLGVPILSLLEVFGGLALAFMILAHPPSVDVGFRLVLGAIALVMASSGGMAMKLSTRRKERDDSEGVRLRSYVKYISRRNEPSE